MANCNSTPICTSTAVNAGTNPATYGSPVTLTAAITPSSANSLMPTGTVTFTDGTTFLGQASVSGAVASLTVQGLLAGSHSITAVYSGDSEFSASNGSLALPVNTVATTTTASSIPNPSVYNQSVTFSASVLPVTGSGVCTGGVTFEDGRIRLGSPNLSGTSATLSYSSLAAGADTVTVSYSGHSNCHFSSTMLGQTVNQATTTTSLSSSASTVFVNQSVTFTATLSGESGGNPSGTVRFFKNGVALGAPVAVTGRRGMVSTSFPTNGVYAITATYSGNSNFAPSASGEPLEETVEATSPTATSLTSSADPSNIGQLVTFTGTVKPNIGSIPNGDTVTFSDGSSVLGTAPTESGVAIFGTSSLSPGSNSITAAFQGDSVYNASTSPALNQSVSKNATTTSLSSNPTSATYGRPVTFSATVGSTGATPTGSVVFKNGSTGIGTGTLSAALRHSQPKHCPSEIVRSLL